MYQYHGWLSTLDHENIDASSIDRKLKNINEPYPTSASYVNGELHISFSGSPNRDLGQTKELVKYLVSLNVKLTGCVYINDPSSERYLSYDLIKIVEDKVIEMHDKNFTLDETKKVFA